MTRRQASAIRTREILIETGLRLAERTSLAGLSINLLVEEAGVAKGTFFHHFGDRPAYLLALHREFHSRIFAGIFDAIDGMDPGAGRLLATSRTYLDACLRDRGVRAFLLEARAERRSSMRSGRGTRPPPNTSRPISRPWTCRTPTRARSCGSGSSSKRP